MDELQMNIYLIRAREAKGYSQQDVAMLSGVVQGLLSQYEHLVAYPGRQNRELIAQALGVRPLDIFPPQLRARIRVLRQEREAKRLEVRVLHR